MSKPISVSYTGACPNCGTVNIRTVVSMAQDEFDKLKADKPDEYWTEEVKKGKKTIKRNRHHSETSKAKCRHSC